MSTRVPFALSPLGNPICIYLIIYLFIYFVIKVLFPIKLINSTQLNSTQVLSQPLTEEAAGDSVCDVCEIVVYSNHS